MSTPQTAPTGSEKLHFLFHVTTGSDNPTKAALSFLVAKTALEEGHRVSIFLAGDAVLLLSYSGETEETLTAAMQALETLDVGVEDDGGGCGQGLLP